MRKLRVAEQARKLARSGPVSGSGNTSRQSTQVCIRYSLFTLRVYIFVIVLYCCNQPPLISASISSHLHAQNTSHRVTDDLQGMRKLKFGIRLLCPNFVN